jgi:transposase
VIAGQRELLSRLRAVVEAKDAEVAALRAELEASRERERRLELRLAELERRLAMDSSDSGTPSSKDRIGAKERRRALRQESERERRKDRRRGGQPGHPGRGLARDPDPGERKDADPPAQCRRCGTGLDGAAPAAPGWAQVVDTGVIRTVTEYSLPGLECPCCGTVTVAGPPPGVHAGSVSYGPALNAAAVVLASYGNVPPERAAHVMAMLLGVPVSAGWVDKAAARLSRQLGRAGFDAAMCAALAAEPVLAADETPVNVLAPGTVPQPAGRDEEDPEDGGRQAPGAPHVLAVRTPGERLTWLQALGSRRKEDVTGGIPARFTGFLTTDGYTAYQRLLSRLAGVQQCCQHVIRRCRAVTKLGPGGLQSWAADVISILREAHQAVEEARARGDTALDPEQLGKLRQRYDEAAAFGVTHNRLRDWHDGNHPGYALGCWLQEYKEQVWLFTREFAVEWTSNSAERAVRGPKRHQAVSGYWHTLATLARWCRIRSYLDSAANHGIGTLDAISAGRVNPNWPHCSPVMWPRIRWRRGRSSPLIWPRPGGGGLEAGGGIAAGWFAGGRAGRDAVERLAFGAAEVVGDLAESVDEGGQAVGAGGSAQVVLGRGGDLGLGAVEVEVVKDGVDVDEHEDQVAGVSGVEADADDLVVAAGLGDQGHGSASWGAAAIRSWRTGGGPGRSAAGRSRCR